MNFQTSSVTVPVAL